MSPYNWHFQSEQMQKMLESGQFSDVTLVVSEPPEQKEEEEEAEQTKRKKIKVHRNILAANSPVFAAMFSHEETSEDLKKEVLIEDVSPETMDRFLSYIYTGSLKGDWTDDEGPFLELLAAADKVSDASWAIYLLYHCLLIQCIFSHPSFVLFSIKSIRSSLGVKTCSQAR